jgi:Metallo-peptidase family M12B Reprolysin-like/Secretion system C-terminal sorting domain
MNFSFKMLSAMVVALFFFTPESYANDEFWQLQNPSVLQNYMGERRLIASKFKLYTLNLNNFDDLLHTAALRDDYLGIEQGIEISIPDPNGRMHRFALVYDPVMHITDQVRFPEIRTYTGWGLDDKTAFMKCDITPRGFHAQVLTAKSDTWYIDPYFWDSKSLHQVYFKHDYPRPEGKDFKCGFDEISSLNSIDEPNIGVADRAGDCQKRTYRLALTANFEYSAFWGGTLSAVTAGMNTTLNRVNGVYEKEFAVRLNLVANNSMLTYLTNPDPFTNDNPNGEMLTENQTACDTKLGNTNYDIGHIFSTGGGGVAYLGAVCKSASKAGGVTGSGSPTGDPFDIDYVAHEMGHQFGGSHTFNSNVGNCSGNGTLSSSFEPGSGTTIMAYAGICGVTDVQPNSDALFCHRSITQITGLFSSTNTCAVITSVGNTAPTANAGLDYSIPKSTAFTLNGVASDVNTADPLTYIWEQNDASTSYYGTTPTTIRTTGAVFRSFIPTTSLSRTVPVYNTASTYPVSSTTVNKWEVLPSVARTLNFRFTVRDNHLNGGCTAEDNAIITVTTAGPFAVTVPTNTGLSYAGNSTQTFTWNVLSTNLAPINCSAVDILLSTDAGMTFGTTIATNVPNNGSASITVPNLPSTTARIKVQARNNIFFDISNNNFTITAALPVELLKFTAKSQKNAINLAWNTTSERNNKNFELQRSTNLNANFETIAILNGHGNSNQKQDYLYLDNKVEKGITYYYRLKQNDFDEKFHFSNIISANLEATLFDFNINPNPVNDHANVQLHGVFQEESAVKFTFSDVQGRILKENYASYSKEEFRFSLANFSSGLYFLSVETEKGKVTRKLWKN